MREITLITENKVGVLAAVCEVLGGIGVNLKAISAQAVGNNGIIRLLTEDDVTATHALEKAGFKVSTGDIITVKMKDRPGELGKIARKLAASGIDIESVYLLGRNGDGVELAIKPSNITAAMAALKK